MNNTNSTHTQTITTYVLSYLIEADRLEELFSTKADAIGRMCELGGGCVKIAFKPVVYKVL